MSNFDSFIDLQTSLFQAQPILKTCLYCMKVVKIVKHAL